jgi:uncharacterized protein YggE
VACGPVTSLSHFCASQINGIGSDNAQTSSVSVNPKYGSGDSSNTIVGYTYSNQINVNVKNLTSDLLSEVLDTAVASGGNQLQIQRVSVRQLWNWDLHVLSCPCLSRSV